MSLSRARRRRVRLLPIMQCWPPPLGRRTRPEPVTLKRLLAARLVFILGMATPILLRISKTLGIPGAGPQAYHPGGGAYDGTLRASQAKTWNCETPRQAFSSWTALWPHGSLWRGAKSASSADSTGRPRLLRPRGRQDLRPRVGHPRPSRARWHGNAKPARPRRSFVIPGNTLDPNSGSLVILGLLLSAPGWATSPGPVVLFARKTAEQNATATLQPLRGSLPTRKSQLD